MKYRQFLISLLLGFTTHSMAAVDIHVLENEALRVELTPDIGGRVLALQLIGHENFFRVGEAVQKNPQPEIRTDAHNILYYGHESWVGPQSAWWTEQNINEKRRAAKTTWPPDPYLSIAPNEVVEKNAQKLIMTTPHSPVSGVELKKTFALTDKKNQVNVIVEAKNIRAESVSWDLWFNTRVHPDTQVYVPVTTEEDVRISDFTPEIAAPLDFAVQDGIFILDLNAPEGKKSRHGKAFIQPSEGWMAGFRGNQVFIVRFALQPLKYIHPEQGQVELYHDYHPNAPAKGVMEMEVHGIYRTLAAGETMSANEQWTLLPYSGPATHEARIDFLRNNLPELDRVK
jgi:hypothetical protein